MNIGHTHVLVGKLLFVTIFFILITTSVLAQENQASSTIRIGETTNTTPENATSSEENTILNEDTSTTSEDINATTSSKTDNLSTTTPPKAKVINNQKRQPKSESSLSVAKQKRITNLASNMSNRMDAVILRFTKIATRLESRIEKMELQNIDTTEAENKLRTAKETLATAKQNISEIDTLVYNATTSERPREGWLAVRETFRTTANLLKQTQDELRIVVISMKNSNDNGPTANIDETLEATTTGTTTSETE